MQGNGINLCDLALNFDENPKGRKAAVFQLNFQRDIKPLLFKQLQVKSTTKTAYHGMYQQVLYINIPWND